MMDAKIQGETGTPPTMDFFVQPLPGGGDIVPMISGAEEAQQEAYIATSIILNSIPQLVGVGVDHLGFLGGTLAFGALDAQIRQFLINCGRGDFYPDYNIVNHGLVVIPTKVG